MDNKQIIMHKDVEICSITLDSRGYVASVDNVENELLLPCVISDNKEELKFGIQKWLLTRMVGRSRSDYSPLRTFYGDEFFISNNRVSLSDCYWMKEKDSDLTWEDVNPYKTWDEENDCYFGIISDPENTYKVDNISPNLTIPGTEHRFWYRLNGQLGYINESSQKDMFFYKKAIENHCEDIVAPRQYLILEGKIYTFSPVETNEDVERVPFDVLYDSMEDKSKSKMENLRITCEHYKLKGWKQFFGCITRLDEILNNKERELSDIGVLRDANTLEIIGFDKI